MNNFQKNLKLLAEKYSQSHIASKTGFSKASINNYLTKSCEPSIQFLIALKEAFGICVDDFLFADLSEVENKDFDRFVGNYLVYYYNNSAYKGEVHTNLANTLNYGVVSIVGDKNKGAGVGALGTFLKDKSDAVKLLKKLNAVSESDKIKEIHSGNADYFTGNFDYDEQSIFLELSNKSQDHIFLIFSNPPSNASYLGGVGTLNTVARGRERNPCVEFFIMTRKIIDKPESELYDFLKFNDYKVNLDYAIKDLIELFKRLYLESNDISMELTENQKSAIIQNKLEYHFNEILEANVFRFAKVSEKEDDMVFKLMREGIDV